MTQSGCAARRLAPALVAASSPPRARRGPDGLIPDPTPPTFARQGFLVHALCSPTAEAVAASLAPSLRPPFALHVFTPDSDAANTLSGVARRLEESLVPLLGEPTDARAVRDSGGALGQVCLLSRDLCAVGVGPAHDAQSLAPGGRLRYHVDAAAPSRAAMKLGEALAWLGHGPEPGDVCVDLGAAPGGWTYVLLKRRAHVVAVDPGALAPSLRRERGVEHLQRSAFEFEPEIPADWLLCDMAWRPLEVAALLAKWGRKHWARFLVANIKLPMKKRTDMVRRVKEILATGGWTGVRTRQLYHDRDEITLTAWRGFGVDARAPRRPAQETEIHRPAAESAPPKTGKPRSDKPRTGKPRSDKPRSDKPRSDKPRTGKPRSDKPRTGKPRSDKPRADSSGAAGPRHSQRSSLTSKRSPSKRKSIPVVR